MHVPSNHPLFGAYERLARADHHIDDLIALQDDARDDFEHLLSIGDYDPEEPSIGPWPMPLTFSVVLGDAVHNLRSALEYLAYELAGEPLDSTVLAKDRQFPICTKPSQFKHAITKAGLLPYRKLLCA